MLIQVHVRANRKIRAREVLVISPDGEKLGVLGLDEAIKKAEDYEMDLVEVAPNINPPVCKIMDYGKYRYEVEQKNKKARKHQVQIVIKEIKLRPKIDKHDYEVKKKHVMRFLNAGAKVKVTIMFRGREVTHPELGKKLLDQLAEDVKDIGFIESPAKLVFRNMIMILASLKNKKK